MCGIAGFIAGHGRLLSNEIICKMASMINHRGPDDEGFVILKSHDQLIQLGGDSTPHEVWDTFTEYRPVAKITSFMGDASIMALAHKRLSVLDLSPAGHQPLSYSSGRFWIVFNGEVYNYTEIRRELQESGYSFKTNTDTEVILAAYQEWGEGCLNKFVGMWAFAIYDRYSNEIFLARDRYGIKPFYYFFSEEGDFFFASEIKQFTVLPKWRASMNPQRVYDQLMYSIADHTDETMFGNVFQLPGGTCFRSVLSDIKPAIRGKLNYKRWYWPKRELFNGSFENAAKTFRSLFEVSVKEHLNADVPVGTALSGGLDSSAIVCEVNRLLKTGGATTRQRTFSSCSDIEKYSEKKWMDIVIGATNVDASFVYPKVEDVFTQTPQIIWHQDEPYQSQSVLLGYNVFKLAASDKVKVLLNGQGADEYLGGYGQFTFSRYAEMVRRMKISELLHDIENTRQIRSLSGMEVFRGIAYHLLPTKINRILSGLSSNTRHLKGIVSSGKMGMNFKHPFDFIPVEYSSVQNISEHLTFYSTLPKYLHWEDRNSMANSIEARVPFLDHRLVEFVYNLPDNYLEKDGISKRVMRQAMGGLLPEAIRCRRDKMGYSTPEEHWVRNECPGLFRKGIARTIDVTNGLIKNEALTYFDNIVEGKIPFDFSYWRLILLGEWITRFDVKLP